MLCRVLNMPLYALTGIISFSDCKREYRNLKNLVTKGIFHNVCYQYCQCMTIASNFVPIGNLHEVFHELFHDGGPYHVETSPLICRANQ